MRRRRAYILIFCLSAVGLSVRTVAAQEETPASRPPRGAGYMSYRVEAGDTVYYDSIDPIWVFPERPRRNNAEIRKYYRLVYNFNKVYPYALAARDLTVLTDRYIAQNELRRGKKEKYLNYMQEQLLGYYKDPLRNMNISQGKLLIRLVDREIGRSSYSIIKDYKNGFAAGFWQGIAKIFGHDLKNRYDPEGEDRVTEYLVEKWQHGEFDALYYSIFMEVPVHPELRVEFNPADADK